MKQVRHIPKDKLATWKASGDKLDGSEASFGTENLKSISTEQWGIKFDQYTKYNEIKVAGAKWNKI